MKTLVKDIRIVTKKDIQSVLNQNMPIAFPTETVYGLGAKIDDIEAIKKIFMLKKRPLKNPMIVHVSNQKMISSVVLNIPKDAKKLIKNFFQGR
jgi:L-threonylcarbamoyladenylate synthase